MSPRQLITPRFNRGAKDIPCLDFDDLFYLKTDTLNIFLVGFTGYSREKICVVYIGTISFSIC